MERWEEGSLETDPPPPPGMGCAEPWPSSVACWGLKKRSLPVPNFPPLSSLVKRQLLSLYRNRLSRVRLVGREEKQKEGGTGPRVSNRPSTQP